MTRAFLIACAALIAVPALSACGLQGRPQRPVPLWGDPPNEGAKDPRTLKIQKDARRRREGAEEGRAGQGQSRPRRSGSATARGDAARAAIIT